jgi:alpha-ribazole phosphatase/probable phosphoglycerate mutase
MNESRDMKANTRVWLIRHGEPCSESRGRCYGQLDIELSLEGRRQLQAVAGKLSEEPICVIYSSPRRRALESASILAERLHCSVKTEEQFREIDFGDFEGKLYDDIAQEYPEIYRQWMEHPTETQFPNGESFVQMQTRVVDAAYKLYARHHGETIAIVSHGGVNRILLATALGVSDANIFRIAQRYAARNLVTLIGDYPLVELMNA